MKPKEYLVLFALAALWGASFLFIKVAVQDMSPLTLVAIRLVLGALGLLLVVPFKPAIMKGWRTHLWAFTVVAIFNAVIPYLAISWGELHITSGMAAILNATTPLTVVIVSNWWPGGERFTWIRVGGVLIGFLGVGILTGPAALAAGGSGLFLLGVLAALAGAISYAFGGLFAHKLLTGLPLLQPAIGQLTVGALMLTPVAGIALAIQPPAHIPSIWAIASALALSLGGTTIAYIFYYWLIDHVGPTRTLVVTYLLPCMALVYGALLLHEAVGLNSIAGLILILSGVFLTGRKTTEQVISFDEQSHSRVKL